MSVITYKGRRFPIRSTRGKLHSSQATHKLKPDPIKVRVSENKLRAEVHAGLKNGLPDVGGGVEFTFTRKNAKIVRK